jgi:hypothetical protein
MSRLQSLLTPVFVALLAAALVRFAEWCAVRALHRSSLPLRGAAP